MTSRSLIQRICVVLGLIALSVFLFYIGKGHTVLLDTNTLTVDGKEMRSLQSVSVSLDGKDAETLGRAERVMVNVVGSGHTVTIIDDANPEKQVTYAFTIPTFLDMVVVSIPAILGDAPQQYRVTVFTPPPLEDAPIEKMQMQN